MNKTCSIGLNKGPKLTVSSLIRNAHKSVNKTQAKKLNVGIIPKRKSIYVTTCIGNKNKKILPEFGL